MPISPQDFSTLVVEGLTPIVQLWSSTAVLYDFNASTTYGTGFNGIHIGRPQIRASYIEGYAVPGAALSAFQQGLREIEVLFSLQRSSTDLMLTAIESLNTHLVSNTVQFRYQPDGGSSASQRYYQVSASPQVELFDGRDRGAYIVSRLHHISALSCVMLCQPNPSGSRMQL